MTSSSRRFTYFSLLGISPESTAEELKKAFRREAKRWHPDLNKNNLTAELRFRWINEAYRVLKDPQKRLEWEISGKPSFEIKPIRTNSTPKITNEFEERSTNDDTSFNSAEKLILFLVVSLSLFIINNFVL